MKSPFKQLARNLRKSQTDAENKLWYFLRSKNLEGLKFRRQVPIDHYIVDFVCLEKRLIIELDGGHHAEEKNLQKDEKRDAYLKKQGFIILRIWNNDVLTNIDGVGEKILCECDKSPSP